MKKMTYILFSVAALLSLTMVSCKVEDVYEQGTPELENCYGVFFPEQENSGSHELDPEAETVLEFTARRLNENGDITVPVVVTASEDGIFQVSEIKFEDGQTETTFNVSFDKAEIGKSYSCQLAVKDPEYAMVYGTNPTFVEFSIIRAKWVSLGMATYTEDLVTYFFQVDNVSYPVEIQENEANKGMYRLVNPYGEAYPYNEPGDYDDATVHYMTINATNSSRVYMDIFYSGMNWGYGEFVFWSIAGNELDSGTTAEEIEAAGYFGKNDNGVITFPAGSLLIAMLDYNSGGLYQTNESGAFKILLPGVVVKDYSVILQAGESVDGKLPVSFSFGPDVKKVKYGIFEGTLSDSDASLKASEIDKDETAKSLTESADIEVSLESTGSYTLVSANYDEAGVMQGYSFVSFGYVAAGDEVPVVVKAGLIVSDKYEFDGFTSENSVEMYINGKDIVSASAAIVKTMNLSSMSEEDIMTLLSANELDEEDVKKINEGGYSKVVGSLNSGTDYTLLVRAGNGFETKLVTASATTLGEPDPIQAIYSMNDLIDAQPETSEAYFGKWDLYAIDGFGDLPYRQKVAEVTILDSELTDTEDDDYIELSGLFGTMTGNTVFSYYQGVIYTLSNPYGPISVQGSTFYTSLLFGHDTGKVLSGNYLMLGGLVDEGYLAFVEYGASAGNGLSGNFDGFYLGVFADEALTSFQRGLTYYKYPLFVKASETGGASSVMSSKAISSNTLKQISNELNRNVNYVETLDGRVKSAIDRILSQKGNYLKTSVSKDTRFISRPVEFESVVSSRDVISNKIMRKDASRAESSYRLAK